MFHVSTRLAATLAAAGLSLLAACSTTGNAPEPVTTAQAPAPQIEEKGSLTGSRIPRSSTDRLLKQINAAGAAEMERSRPPESGPKFN